MVCNIFYYSQGLKGETKNSIKGQSASFFQNILAYFSNLVALIGLMQGNRNVLYFSLRCMLKSVFPIQAPIILELETF